jgi:hypothetical protein
VASAATAVALLAHLLGGGALPGWLGILVPWALSLAVCTALAGRRLSLWRTTASVALSQALFHALFVLGAPVRSAAAGSAPAGMPTGHGAHGGNAVPAPGDAVPGVLSGVLPGVEPAMWFSHAVAAAVTVAGLYGGERALSRLRDIAGQTADWVRRRFAPPVDAVPSFPVVRVVAPDWFTGSFPARPEVSPSRRRGPPRALAT